MNAIDTKYMYTFTKHSDHIVFFWEILAKKPMENILKLIKIFQNEQGTLLNKVELLITASPTLTTYPLLSQLRLTCPHNSLLCWVYSLQLQALLAPGLLSTKDCFLR